MALTIRRNRQQGKKWRRQVAERFKKREAGFSVQSEVYDSDATLFCGMKNDEFILIDETLNKVFRMPTRTTTKKRPKAKIHYKLRLMSAIKFADAN